MKRKLEERINAGYFMMLYLTEAFRIDYTFLRDIEKLIAQKIPVVENHTFPLLDHNPMKAPSQNRRRSSSHSRPKHSGNNNRKRWSGKPKKSR